MEMKMMDFRPYSAEDRKLWDAFIDNITEEMFRMLVFITMRQLMVERVLLRRPIRAGSFRNITWMDVPGIPTSQPRYTWARQQSITNRSWHWRDPWAGGCVPCYDRSFKYPASLRGYRPKSTTERLMFRILGTDLSFDFETDIKRRRFSLSMKPNAYPGISHYTMIFRY